ncbi:hypothetical protein V4U94_002005 [Candida albicans]|nr:hypothetical protein MEU_06074 [Candida albicans P37005]KHC70589.1 hypothetical protein W5Q_06184 [Candida albicans SC5314]KHC77179.1 hypothetical protein I503_06142 [Candida albicans SC5314]
MSSNPAKHIGIKQQKLIEESIKNYVVYYDKTFSSYLKLRSDILELHNTVRLLSTHKEKRNTSNPDDNETKEEVSTAEENSISKDEIEPDNIKIDEADAESFKNKLAEAAVRLEQLKFEADKVQITYESYLNELRNILAIESRKHAEGYQPEVLTDAKNKLSSLVNQETELNAKIDDIKTVQKPLLDKVTNLVSNFNSNITSSTARVIHPSLLRNIDDEGTENSVQVNYNHLVFAKSDISRFFAQRTAVSELNDVLLSQVQDILESNSRVFDKVETQSSSEDSQKLLYKLARSSLHDINQNTDLDEYDDLIDKAIKDISISYQENQVIKAQWSKHARKVEKIKHILEEQDEDGDIEMI